MLDRELIREMPSHTVKKYFRKFLTEKSLSLIFIGFSGQMQGAQTLREKKFNVKVIQKKKNS